MKTEKEKAERDKKNKDESIKNLKQLIKDIQDGADKKKEPYVKALSELSEKL